MNDQDRSSHDWPRAKQSGSIVGRRFERLTDPSVVQSLTIRETKFSASDFSRSRWRNCVFLDCEFRDTYFTEAVFEQCHFVRCKWYNCGFNKVTFQGKDCKFEASDASFCDLGDAIICNHDPASFRVIAPRRLEGTVFEGHSFYSDFPSYLCDEIRSGQQATVYLARRKRDELGVAIKVFDRVLAGTSSDTRRECSHRELCSLRKIQSNYVVQVLHGGLDKQPPFLILERLEGRPLSDWIGDGERFAGDHRSELFRQSFQGLCDLERHCHDGHCIARDIAPKNAMVHLSGDKIAFKYIDFGLSKIIGGTEEVIASRIVGTPLTMAPEVFTGRNGIRSDMFSLGVTLAWTVTGRHPFGIRPVSVTERLASIGRGPDLSGVEEPYLGVLQRCLQCDPNDRFSTAAEVLQALRN